MCLITKWKTPKIAEEDIVCYKYYVKLDGITLVSPYINSPMPKIGVEVHTNLEIPDKTGIYGTTAISLGFHSFKYLDDVKRELKCINYNSLTRNCVRVLKCIIPKGSQYYKGIFWDYTSYYISYCSEAIILKEIVDVE